MKVAKEKVWKTNDGKLVKDGHKDAAFLVAIPGQQVPDSYAKQFDGHGEFFKDINLVVERSVNIPAHGTETEPGSTNEGAIRGSVPAKQEKVTKKTTKGKE